MYDVVRLPDASFVIVTVVTGIGVLLSLVLGRFLMNVMMAAGGYPGTMIPVEARDLMGPMTRELEARLKALLVRPLSR